MSLESVDKNRSGVYGYEVPIYQRIQHVLRSGRASFHQLDQCNLMIVIQSNDLYMYENASKGERDDGAGQEYLLCDATGRPCCGGKKSNFNLFEYVVQNV